MLLLGFALVALPSGAFGKAVGWAAAAWASENDSMPYTDNLLKTINLNHTDLSYYSLRKASSTALLWKDYSNTSISINYNYAHNKQQAALFGNGHSCFSLKADSYIRFKEKENKRDVFWGSASYNYGKKFMIIGSETSDTKLLFPYVLSDSIGGDLFCEIYEFGGGYSRENSTLRYGLKANYRAQLEFRKQDPRPKNVVSDLDLEAGIAFKDRRNYFWGLDLIGGIYNQDNRLTIYNPRGGVNPVNATGISAYLSRFLSSKNILYSGGYYGGVFSLSPKKKEASSILASLLYKNLIITRISSDAQLSVLDLNTLSLHYAELSSTFLAKNDFSYSLNIDFLYKQGSDIIYGATTSGLYKEAFREQNMDIFYLDANFVARLPLAAHKTTPSQNNTEAQTLANIRSQGLSHKPNRFFLLPKLAYKLFSFSRINPVEELGASSFELAADLEKIFVLKNSLALQMFCGSKYSYGLGYSDSFLGGNLSLSLHIPINKYSLAISANAFYAYYFSAKLRNLVPWAAFNRRVGESAHLVEAEAKVSFRF